MTRERIIHTINEEMNGFERERYYIMRKTHPRQKVCVHIEKKVKEIPLDFFKGNACLQEVIFEPGSQLRKIGIAAFYRSALEKINLQECSKLERLDNFCFGSCKRLKTLKINSDLYVYMFRNTFVYSNIKTLSLMNTAFSPKPVIRNFESSEVNIEVYKKRMYDKTISELNYFHTQPHPIGTNISVNLIRPGDFNGWL